MNKLNGNWHCYDQSDYCEEEPEEGEETQEEVDYFETINGVTCPWCSATVLNDQCEHQLFFYDGTNHTYEYIDPSFLKYCRINKMSTEQSCKSDMANDDSDENDDIGIPLPEELLEMINQITFFEFCDTSSRIFYHGSTYGYAENHFWEYH